ncbi:MAG: 16S rRNA (uracil(1498)-N(3))-methyltransferase [Phycisphaerales bacterium]|nr:16S rRNA (uracil(1498)-N(3))-methyltransferase [Phycisphaerales bacterium]
MHWFLVAHVPSVGGHARLEGDEARHAGSRRLRDGESAVVFDGAGTVGEAVVTERGRTLQVTSVRRVERGAPEIEVATALPKGDRAATLLDMGTQLGMDVFTPLETARSVVSPTDNARRRWERVCVEACKQSRRAWLPRIGPTVPPERAAEQALERGAALLLADREGAPVSSVLDSLRHCERLCVFIGPEGGFTDAERDAIRAAGAHGIRLAEGVLRVETAVVAVVALLRAGA